VNYYRKELTNCRNERKKIVDTLEKRDSSSNEEVVGELLNILDIPIPGNETYYNTLNNTLKIMSSMGHI
jgi:hypothetical protein